MKEKLERDVCMHAVSTFIDRSMRGAMTDAGIKRSYGPFLMVVKHCPGCSLKDVAAELHTDKAQITRTASELLEQGYIENTSDKSRVYSLTITKKGDRTLELIESEIDRAWENLLRDLTEEEREYGKRILDKIRKVAEEDMECA